jgi:hypothetical protein
MKDKKLFVVEFGRPEIGFNMFSISAHPPIYVVANDYNEAAEKALAYAEYKRTTTPRNILTDDGSLNPNNGKDEEIKIKAIRLASEEIIW